MKVAVIGAGYWGRKHVQEYLELGYDVSVCDPDPKTADLCRKFGARLSTLNGVLDDPSVTHVSLCAPNHLHHTIGAQVVVSGKHLLVEKPMCSTSGQARDLHKAARKYKVKLLCGHVFRFNSAVQKAGRLVLGGQLGDVLQIKCAWHQRLDFVRDRNILLDIGLHPADIVHYWLGRVPRSASCISHAFENTYAESAILDYVVASELGRVNVQIDTSWISPVRKRDVTVFGSKKTLVLAAVAQQMSVYDNATGRAKTVKINPNNTIRDQLRYFVTLDRDAIENGDKANGRNAVQVLKTLEAAGGVLTRAKPARG